MMAGYILTYSQSVYIILMDLDSFLKSPVVIDNVSLRNYTGEWLYESRIQRRGEAP